MIKTFLEDNRLRARVSGQKSGHHGRPFSMYTSEYKAWNEHRKVDIVIFGVFMIFRKRCL